MAGHHRILSKIKSRLFTSCFNRATIEQSLIIYVGEKLIVVPSLWPDDMDIETTEVFQNSQLGGADQRSCSF